MPILTSKLYHCIIYLTSNKIDVNVRNIDMREDIVSFAENKNMPFRVLMCGISYCDYSYRIERKNSELNVIEYIISGMGTVNDNGRIFNPREGDIYFLKRGENHLYYSDADEPWTKIWLNFSGRLASKITECFNLEKEVYFHAPELKSYFYEFYDISRSGAGAKAVCEQSAVVFLRLAQRLGEYCKGNVNAQNSVAHRVKNYIDDMTDYSQKLDDIALKMSYSKNHIIREFKAEFGITPYEYMLCRRFEIAASLLKNTAYSVSEISEKLGFCDVRYFSGRFGARYGASPSEYRKR